MAEGGEFGFFIPYIHSSNSSEKPITNLGDVRLGLNTVFTGTVSGTDEQEHTVNVGLPFSLANVSEDTGITLITSKEYDDLYDKYSNLLTKFNILVYYLENWIDVGNVTMAGLSDYVEYGDYTVRLVITKPMTQVGETFKIYLFKIPDGFEFSKITEYKESTTIEFATFTTEGRIITFTPTTIPTSTIVMTFKTNDSYGTFDITFDSSLLSEEGAVFKSNDVELMYGYNNVGVSE